MCILGKNKKIAYILHPYAMFSPIPVIFSRAPNSPRSPEPWEPWSRSSPTLPVLYQALDFPLVLQRVVVFVFVILLVTRKL